MDIEKILSTFEKNGFKTLHFATKEELQQYLKNEFKGTSIGFGGSVTLSELEVYETLEESNVVFSHAVDRSPETFEGAMLSEVYILSANAISATGEIVNIDGRGNRVSGSIYGVNRKKVLYICGTNKIEPTLEKALWRAKNISAPKNAKRLGIKTPCAINADKCYNCNSPERICRNLSVLWEKPAGAEYEVILIREKLGY